MAKYLRRRLPLRNWFYISLLDSSLYRVNGKWKRIEGAANDSHSGYGQGAAGYARRFGAALGDGTSARFFSTCAFRRFFTRILGISAKAKEVPGLDSDIPYLVDCNAERFWKNSTELVKRPWEIRGCRIVELVLSAGRRQVNMTRKRICVSMRLA